MRFMIYWVENMKNLPNHTEEVERLENSYDVVIIGCGIAGLYSALQLDSSLSVLMLSKQELMVSNSSLAQGGVAAAVNSDTDSPTLHFQDTLKAGRQENDPEAVRILVEQGPEEVEKLMDYGVQFDRQEDAIHLTLEGGHSAARILHHKDSTGFEISRRLIQEAQSRKNITILEHSAVYEINQYHGFHFHVICRTAPDCALTFHSRFCIIATGGIGRAFQYTTNSKAATGDGISLAHSIGAEIRNLSYIQFHPTGFAGTGTQETFLISEAVRGEGAYLLNCRQERFMHRYDERLELAPRDVVSQAMLAEQEKTGSREFFLDITHQDADAVKERFPLIYSHLLEFGIDMTTQLIPVYPCQHYLMGGIHTDTEGRTNLENLYAVGECAHTGVHGKNRLASNSLLEALVFPARTARDINQRQASAKPPAPYTFPLLHGGEPVPAEIYREVQSVMQRACFVLPERKEILSGLETISHLEYMMSEQAFKVDLDFLETVSLLTIARIVLQEHHASLT